ncbi:Serine/threonine-protein kinase 33 [Porphyridium purpureum]|uniref:Serine/threonine-protein kinase 33 n=1 Tax=Porphyridium purpureum TaxID=35688 RepID=A0A5J4YVL4_PORPP|nr:Serine/threonine-protein kinase 33 [Porphyridium purpureum]|eukprot:POR0954..scf209_3
MASHDSRSHQRRQASGDVHLLAQRDGVSLSALDGVAQARNRTLAKYGITLCKIIGQGGQGAVFSAVGPRGKVAVKMLRKLSGKAGAAQRAHVKAEVKILCDVAHENVLRIIQWFEDSLYYYVVTELVEGKDLFDVAAARTFTENEILLICSDVVEALAAIHARGIAHRDVKLENVLLEPSSFQAKLIDFGFACKVGDMEDIGERRQFPGTLKYQAPEVVQRIASYDAFRADMWAVGVMAFALICGEYPFSGETHDEVAADICRAEVSFAHPVWERVTPDAKTLIKALLNRDPALRPAARQVAEFLEVLMAERAIQQKGHKREAQTQRQRRSQSTHKMESLDLAPLTDKFSSIAIDFTQYIARLRG